MAVNETSISIEQFAAFTHFKDEAIKFLNFDFTEYTLSNTALHEDEKEIIKNTITMYTDGIKNYLEKIKINTDNFNFAPLIILSLDSHFIFADSAYKLKAAVKEFQNLISIENLSLKNQKFEKFYRTCSEAHTSSLNLYMTILSKKDLSLIEDALKRITKIENDAKQAAGITADSKMAIHYDNISNAKINVWKFEILEYNFWILFILLSLGFLIWVSFYFDILYFQIHSSIQSNLIIAPINCFDPTNEKIICMQKLIKNETFDYINMYSYIAARLTTIITLFIFLFFCIKNYNVNKHNYIIYQNKATIFKVSQAARAQYSGENEKLFLEKFAEFLFKLHDTGMGKNTDDGMPYDKVIDMLTKILGQKPDKS